MLTWIAAFVGRWAATVPNPVRDVIHWTAHAIASVVYTVFGNVGKAWRDLLGALQWAHARADEYVGWTVTHLVHLVLVVIPHLAAVALGYLHQALNYALSLYRLALAGIDRLSHLAAQWVRDALSFVAVHVYDPLLALARQLRTDLLKWGYYAYQLVTHPGALAAILLDALIAAAETAFNRIAPPVGKFMLRLVVHQLPQLLRLAEQIVAAVL